MKKNVSATVRELIEDAVAELGYTIWDVTYQKIGADYHLEITIDNENGIGIEDTVRASEVINPILDENDPIPGFYYLEVSSPGTERELRTDAHFTASLGKCVEAKLFTAYEGAKSVLGKLVSFGDGCVVINNGQSDITLSMSGVSKITTVMDN